MLSGSCSGGVAVDPGNLGRLRIAIFAPWAFTLSEYTGIFPVIDFCIKTNQYGRHVAAAPSSLANFLQGGVSQSMEILFCILGLIVGLAIGVVVGIIYRKKVAEQAIGSAEAEATRLINEAIRGDENKKKEMLLEAKDEIHRSRTEHEKEVKERRAELSKQERRLEQKETTLDK